MKSDNSNKKKNPESSSSLIGRTLDTWNHATKNYVGD
jgi:hypothetical protein